jgi:hypothetical protein
MQEPLPDEPIVADVRPSRSAASPPRRRDYLVLALAGLAVLAIALYAWWDWRGAPPRVTMPPPATVASGPVAQVAPPAPPSAPAVRYPIEPAPAAPLPTLDGSDLEFARLMEGLVGRQGLAQLRMTGFVRNFVATVDNLPRTHASSSVWPLNPTPARSSVIDDGGRSVISPDNELRYAPFVLMVEAADMERAVALYRWAYPLFQQAYEELGYPGRHFNDRLVEVIDHLLAAPEPPGQVPVELVKVEGPTQLARPWVHYVFADPQLESLSAGQKIMVRVGPVQERRLKVQLRKLRAALTRPPAPASAPR